MQSKMFQPLGPENTTEGMAKGAAPMPQIVRDPRDGSLKHVVVGEDGTTRVLPLGVKPDIPRHLISKRWTLT